MRKFIVKCSFFLGILFIAWMLIELFYRYAPNNYTEKDKYVVQAYDDAEVLIFGNSHAFYGLNPNHFTKETYNISNVSQTLFYDKLLFDKHNGAFKKLDYIILTVEYTSLSQNDNHPELEWRKYFYEAQMGLDTGLISPFDIKKYSMALVPRFRLTLNSILKYYKHGTIVECASNGFASNYGVNKNINNPQTAKVVMGRHEDGSLNFNHNLTRLLGIIHKCKKMDIKVILINMPVTSHYAANIDLLKRKKIIKSCRELAMNDNVYYLDLFQSKEFVNDDFHDVDHLNVVGAKKCSELVSNYIETIN